MDWAASSMAFNLGFIPEDKLDWKPAPVAKSALEVVNHAVGAVNHIQSELMKVEAAELPVATDLATARAVIKDVCGKYTAWLRTLEASQLPEIITHPFIGTMPFGVLASIPTTDFVHHHGQIAYIQTLLGDAESHFEGDTTSPAEQS
jgi:hypothetical protein